MPQAACRRRPRSFASLSPYSAAANWHQRSREETIILGAPHRPKTELRLSAKQTIEAVESRDMKHLAELPPCHYGAVFESSAAREQ
jgi:hypothetical protein